MPITVKDSPCTFVYRRIPIGDFDADAGVPLYSAFSPIGQSLSVLKNDDAPAATALEHWLKPRIAKLQVGSNNDKARQGILLDKNGRTPDEMYDNGWRVGRLPLKLFTDAGMTVDSDIDEHGHFNLKAESAELILIKAKEWATVTEVVSKEHLHIIPIPEA